MKFTTNLERFLFAKACLNHQENLYKFVTSKEKEFIKKRNAKKADYYNERGFVYLKRINFWQRVANYFEKKVFANENLSSNVIANLNCLMGA